MGFQWVNGAKLRIVPGFKRCQLALLMERPTTCLPRRAYLESLELTLNQRGLGAEALQGLRLLRV